MQLTDLPEHFQKYVSEQPNGCWWWKSSRLPSRNISIYVTPDKTRVAAFRYAWEFFNGPMPEGHGLYVGCFGIACVNPAHRVLLKAGLGKARSRPMRTAARRKREAREFFQRQAEKLNLLP